MNKIIVFGNCLQNTVGIVHSIGEKGYPVDLLLEPCKKSDCYIRFSKYINKIFYLSKIEDSRSKTISDFAQDVQTYRQDLVNNELANRYQYLDYLNNYRQQMLSNILNMLGASQNLSNLSNSYYSNLNNIYSKETNYNPIGDISSLVNTIGSAAQIGLML